MLEGFPIEMPQWNGAVAYAVGLSTQPIADQSIAELLKRPAVFNELLCRKLTSLAVRAAVIEYHLSSMVGDCVDRESTETDFKQLRWGKRFLDAYRQIATMAQRENALVDERIPRPNGLRVLTNSSGRFCAIFFSDESEIQLADLVQFDSQVAQSIDQGRACAGFCMHGKLLPTVDPEIVAYSQASVWLKLLDPDNSGHYMVLRAELIGGAGLK